VRGIDRIELGAERRKGGVAELGHEPADEVARKPRAMFVSGVRRRVDVGLALARPLQKTLLVEPDHDRHDGRVGELARLRQILDNVADRRGTALPQADHYLGLERSEELLLGLLGSAQAAKIGPAHAPIIPRAGRER